MKKIIFALGMTTCLENIVLAGADSNALMTADSLHNLIAQQAKKTKNIQHTSFRTGIPASQGISASHLLETRGEMPTENSSHRAYTNFAHTTSTVTHSDSRRDTHSDNDKQLVAPVVTSTAQSSVVPMTHSSSFSSSETHVSATKRHPSAAQNEIFYATQLSPTEQISAAQPSVGSTHSPDFSTSHVLTSAEGGVIHHDDSNSRGRITRQDSFGTTPSEGSRAQSSPSTPRSNRPPLVSFLRGNDNELPSPTNDRGAPPPQRRNTLAGLDLAGLPTHMGSRTGSAVASALQTPRGGTPGRAPQRADSNVSSISTWTSVSSAAAMSSAVSIKEEFVVDPRRGQPRTPAGAAVVASDSTTPSSWAFVGEEHEGQISGAAKGRKDDSDTDDAPPPGAPPERRSTLRQEDLAKPGGGPGGFLRSIAQWWNSTANDHSADGAVASGGGLSVFAGGNPVAAGRGHAGMASSSGNGQSNAAPVVAASSPAHAVASTPDLEGWSDLESGGKTPPLFNKRDDGADPLPDSGGFVGGNLFANGGAARDDSGTPSGWSSSSMADNTGGAGIADAGNDSSGGGAGGDSGSGSDGGGSGGGAAGGSDAGGSSGGAGGGNDGGGNGGGAGGGNDGGGNGSGGGSGGGSDGGGSGGGAGDSGGGGAGGGNDGGGNGAGGGSGGGSDGGGAGSGGAGGGNDGGGAGSGGAGGNDSGGGGAPGDGAGGGAPGGDAAGNNNKDGGCAIA